MFKRNKAFFHQANVRNLHRLRRNLYIQFYSIQFLKFKKFNLKNSISIYSIILKHCQHLTVHRLPVKLYTFWKYNDVVPYVILKNLRNWLAVYCIHCTKKKQRERWNCVLRRCRHSLRTMCIEFRPRPLPVQRRLLRIHYLRSHFAVHPAVRRLSTVTRTSKRDEEVDGFFARGGSWSFHGRRDGQRTEDRILILRKRERKREREREQAG